MQISGQEGNFKTRRAPVYKTITDHQKAADDWANREKLLWLRKWGRRFIKAFDMKVKDGSYLPMPLIKVESLNIKTVCVYQKKADGYALAGAIVANEKRLKDEPDYETLTHLLEALIHGWLHQHCRDEVFAQESLARFKGLGIAVTKKLITIETGGRFDQLLKDQKIAIPEGQPAKPRGGKSTNKLWSCHCQKVRVGTGSFEAKCLRCMTEFRPGDNVRYGWWKTPPRENGAGSEELPAA